MENLFGGIQSIHPCGLATEDDDDIHGNRFIVTTTSMSGLGYPFVLFNIDAAPLNKFKKGQIKSPQCSNTRAYPPIPGEPI
jgi:hypothetical protein